MVLIDRFVFRPPKTPCPPEKANMYVPRSILYPKDKTSIPCYLAEPEIICEPQNESSSSSNDGSNSLNSSNSEKTVILYSHGNSEDLRNVREFVRFLSADLKVPILAYEYPGYGLSAKNGKPSEKKVYRDVECCLAYLTLEMGFRPERIVVMGFSLGSGPTTYLASKLSTKACPRLGFPTPGLLGGCIIMSGLASCIRTVSRPLAVLFPYIDMFRNIAKIGNVTTPTLVLHGESDPIVPFWHSTALWEKLRPAARWRRLAFPEGTHTNILSKYYNDAITSLREFVAFVSDSAQGQGSGTAEDDVVLPSPIVDSAASPLLDKDSDNGESNGNDDEKDEKGSDVIISESDDDDDDGSVPKYLNNAK